MAIVTLDKISDFKILPGSHFVLAPPPRPRCSENQWTEF